MAVLLRNLRIFALVAGLILLLSGCDAKRSKKKFRPEIACGVCQVMIEHMLNTINETEITHHVQTRFRIDDKQRRPYAWTEYHIMTAAEGVGKDFGDFNDFAVVDRPAGSVGSAHTLVKRRKSRKTGTFKDSPSNSLNLGPKDIRKTYDHLVDKYLEDLMNVFHQNIEQEAEFYKNAACTELMKVCIVEEFEVLIPELEEEEEEEEEKKEEEGNKQEGEKQGSETATTDSRKDVNQEAAATPAPDNADSVGSEHASDKTEL
eukprot:g17489.t1